MTIQKEEKCKEKIVILNGIIEESKAHYNSSYFLKDFIYKFKEFYPELIQNLLGDLADTINNECENPDYDNLLTSLIEKFLSKLSDHSPQNFSKKIISHYNLDPNKEPYFIAGKLSSEIYRSHFPFIMGLLITIF